MKKLLLSVIAAATLVACVFSAACGGATKGSFSDKTIDFPLYRSVKAIEGKGEVISTGNELAFFETAGYRGLYNYIKDAFVYEENIDNSLQAISYHIFREGIYKNDYLKRDLAILKTGESTFNFKVVNGEGKTVLECEDDVFSYLALDLYYTHGAIYRLDENGGLSKVKDKSEADNFPYFNYKINKFYACEVESEDGTSIVFYDLSLNPVSEARIPACDTCNIYPLNSGNILVVCETKVTESDEYSFCDGEDYILVADYLINPSDGAVKTASYCERDFGLFTVDSVVSNKVMGGGNYGDGEFAGEEDSVAIIRRIENKRLGSREMKILRKDGVFGDINGIMPATEYEIKVKDDRWIVKTHSATYLATGSGKVIAQIGIENLFVYSDFFAYEGVIFDYDGKMLFAYDSMYDIIAQGVGHIALMQDDEKVYAFDGKELKELCAIEDLVGVYFSSVIAMNDEGRYKYLNAAGELMFDSDDEYSFRESAETTDVLLAVPAENGAVYRLSVK